MSTADFDTFLARTDFVRPVPFTILRAGEEQVIYVRPAAQYDADYATVEVLDNYFGPEVIEIAPGTTVRWTNYGQHSHTVTSDDRDWDSGELYPGESYQATFHRPGTYYYYCRYHTRDRMQGTIVVGDPGASYGASRRGSSY